VVTIHNKALKFGSCQVGSIYIILKICFQTIEAMSHLFERLLCSKSTWLTHACYSKCYDSISGIRIIITEQLPALQDN